MANKGKPEETKRCKVDRGETGAAGAQNALAASTRLVVGDAVAGRDVDACFCVVGGDAAAHALLDLARHRQESLLDVACVLGRGLEEGDSEAVGKLLLIAGGLIRAKVRMGNRRVS